MRIERSNALVAKTLADIHRDRKKHPQPFSLYDFMPHEDEPELTFEMAAKLFR